ncbi:MAG: ATP-binding protein [FCB group bacterium]|jgi:signal transduction histidine kinase|nr:ATP-binding protein [FCB group bacterium]
MDVTSQVSWLNNLSSDELVRIVDAVYRVHRLISAITDRDTLLERIVEESQQLAHAEASSLMLYDAERDELYFHVALGDTGDQQALKREIRLKLGEGIAGAAAQRRESINVRDVQHDERFYRMADEASRFETRSLLAVPLMDRDRLVGVLEVVNKVGGGCFTEPDMRVMEMFSNLAATALANARLIEENLRSERLAAIGQAVAGLSHYIKNIITGMVGSVELIDQGFSQGNREFLERSWPILKRSTKRIASFVEDMLAFSKVRVPVVEDCDVAALLDEVAQSFWALLTARRVALDVDFKDATRPIRVDQRGIYRCVLNLLINAADAVPPADGRIRLTARPEPGAFRIEVADNGPGIPEDLRQRVFEPFFSTKGSRGTGLGLAVTRKIVEEHGGRISVETSEMGGALFTVLLPQAREERDTSGQGSG